ncbi:hypothetical protein ACNI4F_08540 [Enterobacter hormaechei]|uniref:hypothetical protein n=1 Tax=Enterobacter hormaechei TaxID=158836 RepID=UPI001EB252D3|nr:hypothetical protein [Escherichia coli]MCE1607614.1 hypothetical protein [Enterobacter hormaechei]MCE1620910.1 hypothetical protein [Enterobacter hormaechei]
MKTTYGYDYQYLPKGSTRPIDDGDIVSCSSEENPLLLLPNVGDFVSISNDESRSSFSGIVKTKYFNYIRINDEHVHCIINIVVAESDVDWGSLIKE